MKVLACGDVEGRFEATFARVAKLNKSTGPFDAVLCCGQFTDASGALPAAAPVPTYFIEAPEGTSEGAVGENVHYLGSAGITMIPERDGPKVLTVAFLAKKGDAEKVKEASRRPGYTGADILMTSDWPRGIDVGADEAVEAMARHDIYLHALGSDAPREATQCRPRYHFAGTHDVYWTRVPYRNATHATRFVGLGKSQNKDKLRKWLHAVDIEPLTFARLEEPKGTTDSPFDLKRKHETLFVGGLPASATRDQVASALDVSKDQVRVVKNYAFVDFTSHESADQARGNVTMGGRDVSIDWATRKKQRYAEDERMDCWFCLASPSCETHLVVSVGDDAYVAQPKGPLVDDHALVIPIEHRADAVGDKYEKALAKCFAPRVTVAFERVAPTKKGVYHAHIQVVPLDVDADTARQAFVSHAARHRFRLTEGSKKSAQYFVVRIYDQGHVVSLCNVGDKVPLHFGREVCAMLLGRPDKVHWKACEMPESAERELCAKFKELFAPFDPTSHLS